MIINTTNGLSCNDRWFLASTSDNWGWHSFIDLSYLNDPDKDFIVNDCCFIEIELAHLCKRYHPSN
ncbi:hypothetical protein CASFOL_012382 [Castilleja foliolosa]|uniref:MATH domain-containing protein n=1 Tax=Castilleja foliolosa TaxID=1961234 RepID=A0ABD3DKE5_9LAMI